MSYMYPKNDPKWIQAQEVVAATPNASHVDVKAMFNNTNYEWSMQLVGNHNRWGNPSKRDIIVNTEEYGWFCVWFHLKDIVPYEEEK